MLPAMDKMGGSWAIWSGPWEFTSFTPSVMLNKPLGHITNVEQLCYTGLTFFLQFWDNDMSLSSMRIGIAVYSSLGSFGSDQL